MERMTVKRKDGRWAIANNDGVSPVAQMGKIPLVIDRLAAYEDTGLTPEEVGRMKEYMQPFTIQDMDRFREIMQAEKDGRLVVLPCKRGDTLWSYCWRYCNRPWPELCSCKVTAVSTLDGKTVLNTDILQVISASEIGETVFLTRAEAEAALERRKEEK